MVENNSEAAQTQLQASSRPVRYLPTRHRPQVSVSNRVHLGYPVSAPPTPFPFPPYDPVQTSMVASIARVMDEGGVGAIESPTGTGKTLCALAAVLGRYEYIRQQRGAVPDPSVFRVFYCCRTHSQVGQVVEELTKLPRPPGFTVSVMGSRKQLCLIDEVKTSAAPKTACLRRQHGGTPCLYSTQDMVVQRACDDLQAERDDYAYPDIEDIALAGKARGVCPYSLARAYSVRAAHLIIAPYNYIINNQLFSTAGSCLIIDEAHNLPNVLTDTLTVEIPLELLGAVKEVAEKATEIIVDSGYHVGGEEGAGDQNEQGPATSVVPSPKICQKILTGLSGIRELVGDVDDQTGMPIGGLGEYFINHLSNHLTKAKKAQLTAGKECAILDAKEFIMKFKPIIESLRKHVSTIMLEEPFFVSLFPTVNKQSSAIMTFAQKIETLYTSMKCDLSTLSHFIRPGNNMSNVPATIADMRSMEIDEFVSTFQPTLVLACVSPSSAFERMRDTKIMSTEHCESISLFGPAFGSPMGRPQTIDLGKRDDDSDEPSKEVVRMGMPPISLILISGTLSPLDAFCSELCSKWLVKHANPHIVPADQLYIRSIASFSDASGLPAVLSSAYKDRNDVGGVVALGNLIREATSAVRGGTLLVFPSYSQFDSRMRVWRTNGMVNNNMFGQVPMFFESQKEPLETTLDNYRKCIASDRSAILCVICRGRLSEGIDLKNRQSRLVILCGIPYPSFGDPIIQATMAYHDKTSRRLGITGRDWYDSVAWRAANQALGRVVRHRGDYGAVLLADVRMNQAVQERRNNTLSTWIQKLAVPYIDDGTLVKQLRAFYRDNDELDRNDAFVKTRGRTVAPTAAPSAVNLGDDYARITQVAAIAETVAAEKQAQISARATQRPPVSSLLWPSWSKNLQKLWSKHTELCYALHDFISTRDLESQTNAARRLMDFVRTHRIPEKELNGLKSLLSKNAKHLLPILNIC